MAGQGDAGGGRRCVPATAQRAGLLGAMGWATRWAGHVGGDPGATSCAGGPAARGSMCPCGAGGAPGGPGASERVGARGA